jgi:uncharacterized protein (DUF1684 family)
MLPVFLIALVAAVPASPVALPRAPADSVRHAIEKERKETEEWLRAAPTSYLATVQRRDFGDLATLGVGRAAGNEVRIEDPAVAEHHLRVTVLGDSFRVEAVDAEASFRVKERELREAVLGPGPLQIGRYQLRLSHQRFPAIIVFDPQSPRYREYKGLSYFPVDLTYRFELPLTADPSPDTVIVLSTRGHRRRALRAGWFDFKAGGRACRLEAVRLLEPGVGETDLSIYFRDRTSGKQSYGMGRYLDVSRQENGLYLLDFNLAYNPACAFSEHYNCPIPSRANSLQVEVRAGEMDSHYLDH